MLRYMLDTSICVRILRGRPPPLVERLDDQANDICISTIAEYELVTGAELSACVSYQSDLVAQFIKRLVVLDFDSRAAWHAANIRADLQRRGQIIGNNDLLIAGHARSRGLKLVTGNLKEFNRVEGLRCEDWL